jgi:hypothetical protein
VRATNATKQSFFEMYRILEFAPVHARLPLAHSSLRFVRSFPRSEHAPHHDLRVSFHVYSGEFRVAKAHLQQMDDRKHMLQNPRLFACHMLSLKLVKLGKHIDRLFEALAYNKSWWKHPLFDYHITRLRPWSRSYTSAWPAYVWFFFARLRIASDEESQRYASVVQRLHEILYMVLDEYRTKSIEQLLLEDTAPRQGVSVPKHFAAVQTSSDHWY